MDKYYLGIFGARGPNPAAALLKNNKLIALAEEERFIRIKNAPSYLPINSIKYCLKKAKIKLSKVKAIGFAWKCPQYKKNVIKKNKDEPKNDNKISNYYNEIYNKKLSLDYDDVIIKENLKFLLKKIGEDFDDKKLKFLEHHKCHAASAFYCSGFKKASILIMDGSGEDICTSLWKGNQEKLEKIEEFKLPHSLGGFYASFTEFLGFKADSEEGKLMGLAPYGSYSKELQKKINNILSIDYSSEKYSINSKYRFNGKRSQNTKFTDNLCKIFGKPRLKNEKLTKYHRDLAFNVQFKLEEVSLFLAKKLIKKTKIKNLCIAGGVGMNCKMNGQLSLMKEVDNIFIQPASSDNGTSLGAAQIVAVNDGVKNFTSLSHAYYGPEFNNKEILKAIKETKLKYEFKKNISTFAAEEIYSGKIIGWFQGRAEFGARSLGGRSILANPLIKNMKNKINLEVKHRENWIRFCPSILSDDFKKFFDTKDKCEFMILAKKIKKEFRNKLSSVVHRDGSARPQSVYKENNNRYYSLLKEFKKKSGYPILLNTSFNIQGEPIVNSPIEAIRCFSGTGIDTLIIGNYIISK